MSTKGRGRGKKTLPAATGLTPTTQEIDNIVDSTTEMTNAGKMESAIENGKKATKRKHVVEQSAGKSNDNKTIKKSESSNGFIGKNEKNKKKGASSTNKKNKGAKKVIEPESDEEEEEEEDIPEPEPVEDIPEEIKKPVKGKRGRPTKIEKDNELNGKVKKNKGGKKVVEIENKEDEDDDDEQDIPEPEPEPVEDIVQEKIKSAKKKRGRPTKGQDAVTENELNGKGKKTIKTAGAKKLMHAKALQTERRGKRVVAPEPDETEEDDEDVE